MKTRDQFVSRVTQELMRRPDLLDRASGLTGKDRQESGAPWGEVQPQGLRDSSVGFASPPIESTLEIDDYLALFYERAAIREFDSGASREVAERAALAEVLALYESSG